MKLFRTFALSAALLSIPSWVFAQDSHGWQYQDRDDRGVYRQGYEQGRNDVQSGRRFHPDSDRYREGDDRRAYREGYEAGFNSGGRRNDHDRDGDHDRNDHAETGITTATIIPATTAVTPGTMAAMATRRSSPSKTVIGMA